MLTILPGLPTGDVSWLCCRWAFIMHSREANYPIEVDDVNGEGDDDGILNSQ
jgi:hypothetical protein